MSFDFAKNKKLSIEEVGKLQKRQSVLKNEQLGDESFTLFRCLFCKHEVAENVTVCPYCGASGIFMVSPDRFFHYDIEGLSEIEEEDLLVTFGLEKANMEFYKEAEDMANDEGDYDLEGYYRYGRRHESYHLDEAAAVLGVDPDTEDIEYDSLELPETHDEIFLKARRAEQDAAAFYTTAQNRANHEDLIAFYQALIDAEIHHINMFNYLISN